MEKRETRNCKISKKVFTKEDLLKLARVLLNEASTETDPNYYELTFQTSFADESSYESSSVELLSEGEIDEKKATIITMNYRNWRAHRRINITIANGGEYNSVFLSNHISVSGEDELWVKGAMAKFREILKSIKPQDNWLLKHQKLSKNVLSFLIGLLMQSVFEIIFNPLLNRAFGTNPNWVKNPALHRVADMYGFRLGFAISLILLIWLSGLGLGNMLLRWLVQLWSNIEFSFGPDHMNRKAQIRKRLLAIFSLVIIPIIVAMFANVITPFFTLIFPIP